jgi:hypothetical protein
MKKLFLFALCATTLMFSSCKKDDPVTPAVDPRDKFVGSWSGNFSISIPNLSISESGQTVVSISKSGSNSSQIIVDGNSANVNGNSYSYNQFTETINDPDLGDIVLLINGIGTLNGSNLNESGTVSTVIQGTTFNGTWSTSLVKQ